MNVETLKEQMFRYLLLSVPEQIILSSTFYFLQFYIHSWSGKTWMKQSKTVKKDTSNKQQH